MATTHHIRPGTAVAMPLFSPVIARAATQLVVTRSGRLVLRAVLHLAQALIHHADVHQWWRPEQREALAALMDAIHPAWPRTLRDTLEFVLRKHEEAAGGVWECGVWEGGVCPVPPLRPAAADLRSMIDHELHSGVSL